MNEEKKINENPPFVSNTTFEGVMAMSERHTHRIWIALILCAIALIVSIAGNIIIVYKFAEYVNDFDTVIYEQDGEGVNNVNLGSQGDIYNENNKKQEN